MTCTDVRLEDAVAWETALPDDTDPAEPGRRTDLAPGRLGIRHGPAARRRLGRSAQMRLARPPTSELRLSTEDSRDQPCPGLGRLIDLGPLRAVGWAMLPEMAVAIIGAPAQDQRKRQIWLRHVLYAAQQYGLVRAYKNRCNARQLLVCRTRGLPPTPPKGVAAAQPWWRVSCDGEVMAPPSYAMIRQLTRRRMTPSP